MAVRQASRQSGGTKARILDAAEDLFIEHGFEAMSMRQITSRAAVNLAAVNYHFGSKEALIHAMLSRRLDQLNEERLRILDRFDAQLGPHVTCEHVLGAMFIPALQASRDPQRGGRAFLRLIGRAYTDPSAFVRNFLTAHYASVAGRFFDAFQRALPNLPRAELGWRLHYAIGALSGALAGAETESLIDEFTQGRTMNDVQMIARLSALIVAALKAPMPDSTQLAIFAVCSRRAGIRRADAGGRCGADGTAHRCVRGRADRRGRARNARDLTQRPRATSTSRARRRRTCRVPAPALLPSTPTGASRGKFAPCAADTRTPAHTNDSGDKR